MERSEEKDSGGTFEQLICQDTDTDSNPVNPEKKCWRCQRPAAVSLGLLAIALFATDIGLGLHYKNLKEASGKLHDIDQVLVELKALEDTFENVMQTVKDAQRELASEENKHQEPKWEQEHQLKRSMEYESQIKTLQEDVQTLQTYLTGLDAGCRHCPPGWIFMHSMCYFIPFASYLGPRPWAVARTYCQMYGGDLAKIDSKDKENATVKLLRKYPGIEEWRRDSGFWIGLVSKDKIWQWLDGRDLVEGYWDNAEPKQQGNEVCGAIHPCENFFKAWKTQRCGENQKWICEKIPYF